VRIHRDLYAWIVLTATLAGAVWLYTYRGWEIIEHTDPTGRSHLLPSERVRMQPWWSVYAAVALMLIGAAVIVWLLPEQKRKRLIRRFAKLVSPVPSR
jgi:cytochrome bd-type quinol oxidase subunit 2